ncbi:MAG TPA: HAD family hydrolase [Bacteroidales bacterium]|nr:HAD family hydrolase [Bacteroidales bacterium]
MNKAVFLDRDGIINNEEGLYYIYRPEDFAFTTGIKTVLKSLRERGYLLIIVTNQGGIAKGLYKREDVDAVHRFMNDELRSEGIVLDEIYICPHHPDVENCLCRKPQTISFEKAIARFNLDTGASWFVGDRETDMQAGKKAGLKTILAEANRDMTFLLDIIG